MTMKNVFFSNYSPKKKKTQKRWKKLKRRRTEMIWNDENQELESVATTDQVLTLGHKSFGMALRVHNNNHVTMSSIRSNGREKQLETKQKINQNDYKYVLLSHSVYTLYFTVRATSFFYLCFVPFIMYLCAFFHVHFRLCVYSVRLFAMWWSRRWCTLMFAVDIRLCALALRSQCICLVLLSVFNCDTAPSEHRRDCLLLLYGFRLLHTEQHRELMAFTVKY